MRGQKVKENINNNNARLKRNYLTLAIIIASVFMLVYVVHHIYFDSSFGAFIDENSDSLNALAQVAMKFGDANTLMLLIDLDQDEMNESLSQVHSLVMDLRELGFVNGVDSIFEAQRFEGFSLAAPFVKTSPYVLQENGAYTLDKGILEDDFYTGSLISKDGQTLAISIRKRADYQSDTLEVVSTLYKTIRAHIDLPFHLIGEDIVDYELFASIKTLTFVYPPIIILVVFGIFMLKFANLYLSFLTIVPPILSSIWIYFLLLILGKDINTLTVLIPSFLIIIGSAYGMHFLSRFLDNEYDGDKKTTLIRKTILEEKTPIYFSALTTMAGFISYIFLKMQAFREMGLFIAIGIFLCAVFTMNVIPSLLSFSKNTHNQFQKHRKYNLNFPKWMTISFIVFTFVGICVAPFIIRAIPLEIDSYDYFKDNSQLMRGVHHLEDKFKWVSNFYLMVEQKDSKTFVPSPEDVEQLMEIGGKLEEIGVVSKNLSVFGLSKSMNLSPNLLLAFIRTNAQDETYTKTFYSQNAIRYMLFVTANDSNTAQILVDEINKILKDYPQLRSNYSFFSAGIPLLWSELSVAVVENQIQSLILSFILIFILLLIIFKKLSTSLFSAIPIGLTIMFNFVFMGLFKIPLEIPTAIISGMLMGLVIDYAIHFMYWFKKMGNTADAYEMTASPIIFNGVSLIASFVVLLTAPMMLYVKLAILMVLGIGVGIMTTLVFLPQMLRRFSSTKK